MLTAIVYNHEKHGTYSWTWLQLNSFRLRTSCDDAQDTIIDIYEEGTLIGYQGVALNEVVIDFKCPYLSNLSVSQHMSVIMMTSSNGNIFRVTGPLCGEFTGPGEFPTQRPVTRSFDVFFDLRLNKRLSKQPWGWWFETPSWSLWRQCNVSWKWRHMNAMACQITNNSIVCSTAFALTPCRIMWR